jgi:hypothetical protein
MIALVLVIIAGIVGYSGIAARNHSGEPKASDLLGLQVVGTHGKYLGKINDLIINQDGDIVYALIDLGASSMGEENIAVPGKALRSSENGTKIVLDTTFDEFYESVRLADDTMQPS